MRALVVAALAFRLAVSRLLVRRLRAMPMLLELWGAGEGEVELIMWLDFAWCSLSRRR